MLYHAITIKFLKADSYLISLICLTLMYVILNYTDFFVR